MFLIENGTTFSEAVVDEDLKKTPLKAERKKVSFIKKRVENNLKV